MYHAATIAIHVLTVVFLAGMLGSAVVVLLSFFDDFTELFSSDKTEDTLPHMPKP